MKTDVRNTEGCLWVCPVHRAPWSVVWGRASPRASGVGQRRGMPVPAGYVLTSPQSQPPTAVRWHGLKCGRGVCWMRVPVGTGWRGWGSSLWAMADVWGDIKHAPYVSRAGHVHGLGQAFRMALHALGVFNELPGLSDGRRRETGQCRPWRPCCRMLSGFTCLRAQMTQITSLRKSRQF